jgi:hypothetical protein
MSFVPLPPMKADQQRVNLECGEVFVMRNRQPRLHTGFHLRISHSRECDIEGSISGTDDLKVADYQFDFRSSPSSKHPLHLLLQLGFDHM